MVCNSCRCGVHCNGDCKCSCGAQLDLFSFTPLQSPAVSERRTIIFIEVILTKYIGKWFTNPVQDSRWLSLQDCEQSIEDRAKRLARGIEDCGHDVSVTDVFEQVRDVVKIFRVFSNDCEVEYRAILKKVRK